MILNHFYYQYFAIPKGDVTKIYVDGKKIGLIKNGKYFSYSSGPMSCAGDFISTEFYRWYDHNLRVRILSFICCMPNKIPVGFTDIDGVITIFIDRHNCGYVKYPNAEFNFGGEIIANEEDFARKIWLFYLEAVSTNRVATLLFVLGIRTNQKQIDISWNTPMGKVRVRAQSKYIIIYKMQHKWVKYVKCKKYKCVLNGKKLSFVDLIANIDITPLNRDISTLIYENGQTYEIGETINVLRDHYEDIGKPTKTSHQLNVDKWCFSWLLSIKNITIVEHKYTKSGQVIRARHNNNDIKLKVDKYKEYKIKFNGTHCSFVQLQQLV